MSEINTAPSSAGVQHIPVRLITDDHHTQQYDLPPFPNGWFVVLTSKELKSKGIMPLKYFGRELVAFRGEDGQAHIMNAFCPHYGAHLGYESKVVGNHIECPFHGWQFDGDGRCQHAPFAAKPPGVGVRSWPIVEKDGFIYIWYHVRGDEPDYDVPVIEEATGKGWRKFYELRNQWPSHIQELRENIVDESHFNMLHRQKEPPVVNFTTDGRFGSTTMKITLGKVDIDFGTHMIGPGIMLARSRGLIDSCAVACTTPIDENTVEMRFFCKVKNPYYSRFLGWFAERIYMYRARNDVKVEDAIWRHKTYLKKPVFLRHEVGIRGLREWYQQFYDGHDDVAGNEPQQNKKVAR